MERLSERIIQVIKNNFRAWESDPQNRKPMELSRAAPQRLGNQQIMLLKAIFYLFQSWATKTIKQVVIPIQQHQGMQGWTFLLMMVLMTH